MSKSVKIPTSADPFVVEINNKVYSYKAGTTQTVPDDVAAVIDNYWASQPIQAPEAGTAGQVWTKQSKGADWSDLPDFPDGTEGQVWTFTSDGAGWDDLPDFPEFPIAENVPESTATTIAQLKTDFNALLTALINAGLMEEPEPEPEDSGDPETTE